MHDSIFSFLHVGETRGAKVSRTTGGVFVEPIDLGGGSGSRVNQYVLTHFLDLDYFTCRTVAVDKTGALKIGSTNVYIATPFALRVSPFDRDLLNAAAPGAIGTPAEIAYSIPVESWDGATLTTTTRKLSFEYVTATFRIATDQTDPDPDNWFSEKQTIIPRLVPAVLTAGPPITTATISPTLIYAVRCGGLGVIRPDNPALPIEQQKPVPVTLLALSDGWAWAKVKTS